MRWQVGGRRAWRCYIGGNHPACLSWASSSAGCFLPGGTQALAQNGRFLGEPSRIWKKRVVPNAPSDAGRGFRERDEYP